MYDSTVLCPTDKQMNWARFPDLKEVILFGFNSGNKPQRKLTNFICERGQSPKDFMKARTFSWMLKNEKDFIWLRNRVGWS